jgi:hypothetical protein
MEKDAAGSPRAEEHRDKPNLASRLPYVRWIIRGPIPSARRRFSGSEPGSSVLPTAERHGGPEHGGKAGVSGNR